ncbi:MAG: hypothetical protein ACI9W6_002194 [Motiliproteus sp.]|jgi:hypothetical protein
MQHNKLRIAIRTTAAVAILGAAGQVGAVTFNANGYETSIYGYARFNASYDIDENISNSTQSGSFETLDTTGTDQATGHFGADAVQTRLGVKTVTPEGVTVVIEGDFRGNTLRLRHGYGEYHGILLGQTWSNFNSFVGNTSTLDFDSLAGLAGLQGRKAQARYTTGPLSFSLEDPSTSILDSDDVRSSSPAATVRLEDSAGGLSYSVAGLVHEVTLDTGALVGGNTNESTVGFATFVAASMALTDMLSIQGTLSYSDGANAYLYRSGDNFGAEDAYLHNGSLESIAGYGGSIGAGLDLGGGRSINAGYGMVTVDWDDAERDLTLTGPEEVGNKSKTNQNLMVNYQWTPVKHVTMGVEYAYFKRKNQDGEDGSASRILFGSQYNF